MAAMTLLKLIKAHGLLPTMEVVCVKSYTASFSDGERFEIQRENIKGMLGVRDRRGKFYPDSWSLFDVVADEGEGEPVELDEPDIVANPNHYARLPIQPIEFILKNNLPGHVANIVKYSCRAGHKLYPNKTAEESEIIDLEKTMDWAEKRIRCIRGEAICR